jgi:hypothetical protein
MVAIWSATMRREHLVVGDHSVIVEHAVEHDSRRATSREMINSYARTGRYLVNVPDEKEVQHVFYHHRLVGTIRKSNNGTFISGRYASRDRNGLIEIMLGPFTK